MLSDGSNLLKYVLILMRLATPKRAWSVLHQALDEHKAQNNSDRRDKKREALGNVASASFITST